MCKAKKIKKRLRREIKLNDISDNFTAKIGTINRLEPKSIYIIINSWVTYHGDENQYNNHIQLMEKVIRRVIKEETYIIEGFSPFGMLNLDIRKRFTNNDSPFYMQVEVTLRQNSDNLRAIKTLTNELSEFINNIIMNIELFDVLKFSKTKN